MIAGMDEAGLGPKLGPLVIGATAFRVPDALSQADLWKVLVRGVTRWPGARVRKLVVADSKKVYSPQVGVGVLEETVLSFLALSGQHRKRADELLSALAGEDHDYSRRYPWYNDQVLELPLTGRALGSVKKAERLRVTLAEAGVEFLGARVLPVFESALNEQFARSDNKSDTLFTNAARLLSALVRRYAEEGLIIVVDKHGGRDRYAPLLSRPFPHASFVIHGQGRTVSHYELKGWSKPVHISFVMSGEDASLPVALASMHAKYVRELYMLMFSNYWQMQAPEVKPTAGYGRDAGRFLREAAPAISRLNIPDHMLVRQR